METVENPKKAYKTLEKPENAVQVLKKAEKSVEMVFVFPRNSRAQRGIYEGKTVL